MTTILLALALMAMQNISDLVDLSKFPPQGDVAGGGIEDDIRL